MAGKDPQRAAMGGQFLNPVEFQSVRSKNGLDRVEREIGKMFMIARIKLAIFHHFQQMRKHDRYRAAFAQQYLEAGDKIVDVGNMGHDIIGRDEIRHIAVCHLFLGALASKEFNDGFDPVLGTCFLGDIA